MSYVLKFHNDSLYLADWNNIYILDKNTLQVVKKSNSECSGDYGVISSIDVDSSGNLLYTCFNSGFYLITPSNETLFYNYTKYYNYDINSISFGADGKLLASVGQNLIIFQ